MRLCNTDLQINCFTFSHLYVVVQLVWIAAFWFRQSLSIFAVSLPEKFHTAALARLFFVRARFLYPFLIRKRLRPYRCRSPPSDFDFAINSNIEIGGNYYEENQSSGLLPVLYTGHAR